MPSEQKWYALTGRVVDAKVEADGDIHIALQDATGNAIGTVSAEIPIGPKWCEIRETVLGWTTPKFPFGVKTAHTLEIREPLVRKGFGSPFRGAQSRHIDASRLRASPKIRGKDSGM